MDQAPTRVRNKDQKIEQVCAPNGNEVWYCPSRGGIITSLKFNRKEILYLDQETFENTDTNVRGGIPILFPNAGALNDQRFPNLSQHGFARQASTWLTRRKDSHGFIEILESDASTKKIYPYNFLLSIEGVFEENNSFTLRAHVENKERENDMPISMGLHPYFKVSSDRKQDVQFNFPGGETVKEKYKDWSQGNFISIENPKKLEIVIPDIGTLRIHTSDEYQKIWVWSLPEKDFICIEPVMQGPGGLTNNPLVIKPRETKSPWINISFRE